MSTSTERLRKHRKDPPKKEILPRTIRHLLFAMAIPSVLGGCAHPPTSAESVAAKASKRVFRVGPSPDVRHGLDTYAATLPELSDSLSSAAIMDRILLRHKMASEATKTGKNARLFRDRAKSPLPGRSREEAAATGVKVTPKAVSRRTRGRGDQWETVRSRLVLADVAHEMVDEQVEHFRRHPGAVDFLMKRAEPYLQYLLQEINRHGLPADLVLVPMVESAFETTALSPKQAAGLWQFIPGTGQQYGLQVTEAYDGRYDVHASTHAALKYLKHLNQLFHGDWLLALAAYNSGEGRVQRAIDASRKAGREGSFWDLDLPAETEAYVLKILALSHVVADPQAYGLKPRRTSGQPMLTRVEVAPDVRIADVISASGLASEDFYKLNPAFRPDAEPPVQTRNLLMPADKAETLAANVAGAKVHGMRKVVVRKGETLSALAKRHGVSALKLAEWNGLNPKTPLKAGQELVVFPV